MNEQKTKQTAHDIKLEKIKADVETHGILFNFKEGNKLRTGIIRKGEYTEGIFKNGWLPDSWAKMNRQQRKKL